jgi:two-component system phosphate regulon sensor histidine kinase PhoR
MLRRLLSSFRLAVLWPLLIAAIVAGAVLWVRLPRVLEASAAQNLTGTLPILTSLVAERLGDDSRVLQDWATTVTRGTELRMTVIRGDGVVIADSSRTWEQVGAMDNHRSRPEIEAALKSRQGSSVRTSATTGLRYVYVAHSGVDEAGGLFVLRLAQPLHQLEALESRLLQALILTGLASGLAVLLVWAGLDRQLFRPLGNLVEGADRLARGDFSAHLEEPDAEALASLAGALNRLSDRVQDQIETVRSERNHLEEILASMADGVLVTDADGHVALVNPAFCSLFGLDPQASFEGKTPLELTRRPELVSLIDPSREAPSTSSAEHLVLDDGRVLSATALPVSAGGALLTVHDITERFHLDEMRRDFVANVSHEIKTPLTAIRGYAETLKEGALEEAEVAAKFTGRILAQCVRLEELLSDLLPLARMEAAERQGHERQPIDLAALIEQAIEIVRPVAEAREIAVAFRQPHTVPEYEADRDALEQLVSNLLNNAVKYNRDGGEVTVTLESDEEAVSISVADTGIEIPGDSIPRVFERFYRVDKGRARAEGGTGLGLALVKHAAKLHGGQVDLESRLGVGSTFSVRLPRTGV